MDFEKLAPGPLAPLGTRVETVLNEDILYRLPADGPDLEFFEFAQDAGVSPAGLLSEQPILTVTYALGAPLHKANASAYFRRARHWCALLGVGCSAVVAVLLPWGWVFQRSAVAVVP